MRQQIRNILITIESYTDRPALSKGILVSFKQERDGKHGFRCTTSIGTGLSDRDAKTRFNACVKYALENNVKTKDDLSKMHKSITQ